MKPSSESNGDRPGLSTSRRARVLAAVAEIACERGPRVLTAEQILARSGVSQRAFNALFTDSRQCFAAAFDDSVTLARRRVLAAYESDDDWAQRLRTALEALPVLLESEPERARLCLVHAPMAGAEMMMRCRAVVEEATRAIELSGASAISQEVSHVLVKHAVGEAYGLVHRRLGEEGRTTLLDLLPVLTRLLRAPFCGLDPEGLARPDGA